MQYLLDTNVVSELRRVRPHGAVIRWIEAIPAEDLFLSAVTIGEIQAGIELTRERDPEKAADIESWLDQVADSYNVVPINGPVFRCWAKLMHRQSNDLIEDGLIAASAMTHNLIVVTRNVKDFAKFRVKTLNPFNPAPES
jgi:Predicted nucleic acid-binding protein, contains PIN domain